MNPQAWTKYVELNKKNRLNVSKMDSFSEIRKQNNVLLKDTWNKWTKKLHGTYFIIIIFILLPFSSCISKVSLFKQRDNFLEEL